MNPIKFGRLSVMMFLQFFLWGSWYVAGPLYLGTIGFGGEDFGWMYSVGPIAGMISPFFVGMIADRFFSTERILGVLHLIGGGFMLAAIMLMGATMPEPFVTGADSAVTLPRLGLTDTSPLAINLLFFGHMLCYYPTLALTNSLALHHMKNPEKVFPYIRVFGTIGWIVAGIFISWQVWDAAVNVFYVAAAAAILMGLYCFTLPHTPPPSKGKKMTVSEVLGFDALVLFRKPSFLIFMLCSFLVCIPLAFYYQLTARFITQGGLSNPAFKMTFGQISEIFFMLLMPLFFVRLGVKWMLFVGMGAWVLRYALFALGAPDGVMWMMFLGIVLHGICYDFFFVTGQIYTDRVAPTQIRGQAQGLLVFFTLGLGMFVGAQIAGKVEVAYTTADTELLKQEGEYIGHDIETQQDSLDESLDSASESTKEGFEQAKKDLQPASDTSGFWAGQLALLQNTFTLAPTNEFSEQAEEATEEVQMKIDEVVGEINDLKENPPGDVDNQVALREKEIAQLELIKEKLELLNTEAAESAQAKIDELEEPLDSEVETLVLQQENIDRLAAYQGLKASQAEQKIHWQMIWTLPAVFAAVVMVFFALVFKDDTKETGDEDEQPPAEEPVSAEVAGAPDKPESKEEA